MVMHICSKNVFIMPSFSGMTCKLETSKSLYPNLTNYLDLSLQLIIGHCLSTNSSIHIHVYTYI